MSRSTPSLLSCSCRLDLANLLGVNVKTLSYYAFSKGKQYRQFEIPKKSGGSRIIKAPVGGLLTIQKKLAGFFEEIYPPPPYVQGFVKNGSIVQNAELHLNRFQVLNIDLVDFFPTITSGRIIGLLRSKPFNFNDEMVSTLAGLMCDDNSLPQGAPTSPILSNMICLRMDKALYHLCKSERAYYSRYADDITISTNKKDFKLAKIGEVNGMKCVNLNDDLVGTVTKNWFMINPKKTRLRIGTNSKYVTGVKVNIYPNVPRHYVRQLRSMINAWAKFGPVAAQSDFDSKFNGCGRPFTEVVRGRLAHLKNVKGEDDLVYRRLYNKFVELEGAGRPLLPVSELEDLFSKIFVIESGVKYGTGFIMDNKWLISCDHTVVDTEVKYYLHNDSMQGLKKRAQIDPKMRSPVVGSDLIALAPLKHDLKNLKLSFKSSAELEEVKIGDRCRVVGFPGYVPGGQPYLTPVTVTSVYRDTYGYMIAAVDKPMISGSSGSPVLNERNEVIGMVQRGSADMKDGVSTIGHTFLTIQEIMRCLKRFEILSLMVVLTDRHDADLAH